MTYLKSIKILILALLLVNINFAYAKETLLFAAKNSKNHKNLYGYNSTTGKVNPVALPNPNDAGGPPRYDIFDFNGSIYGSFITPTSKAQIGRFNGKEVDFIGSITNNNFDPQIDNFLVFQGDLYFALKPDGSKEDVIRYGVVT